MTDSPGTPATPETAPAPAVEGSAEDVAEQKAVRLAKRARLNAEGGPGEGAYPVQVPVTTTIPAVRAEFGHLEPGEETDHVVGIAGRVVHFRNTGKLCFATLQAGDGTRIQAMISLAEVGDEALAAWKELVDLGDHVFVAGRVIASRKGELSIMGAEWRIASKALLPLPNLHSELSDETRVRSRYLDLIVRDQARKNVLDRAKVNASMRETFRQRGYVEVETPMLQVMHGGASARPFVTHSNAFDTEMYLRIAPELYLKRAVVGGIDRVFEINRNFRNEGADSTHSPEFAMLEAYEAYGDYTSIAELTQTLVQDAAMAVAGSHVVTWADGTEYDLGGEWDRISMYGSLSAAAGFYMTPATTGDELQAIADREGVVVPLSTHGKLVEELWEHFGQGASSARPSCSTSRSRPPRSRARTAPSRASSRSGTSTSAASSWPPATPSSWIPSCSASASSTRRASRRAATTRPCRSTRSSSVPWSTACRPRAAWAWGSTGSSWPSPVSASARPSCSP